MKLSDLKTMIYIKPFEVFRLQPNVYCEPQSVCYVNSNNGVQLYELINVVNVNSDGKASFKAIL